MGFIIEQFFCQRLLAVIVVLDPLLPNKRNHGGNVTMSIVVNFRFRLFFLARFLLKSKIQCLSCLFSLLRCLMSLHEITESHMPL